MIAFDCESTGISIYNSEIITSYFIDIDTGEFYNFESQVNKWDYEAEKIHRISEATMHTYPPKDYAYEQLLKWLPDEFTALIYSNPRTIDGYLYFDTNLLQMELMNHLNIDRKEDLPVKINTISVYDLAKSTAKKGYFTPIRGESGRESFKQEAVYEALFGYKYDNAHDAKVDVLSMIKIYNELNDRLEKGVVNRNQLELI